MANPDKANNTCTGLWEPVSIPEMKQFLILVLLMCILRKPNIHMVWSTSKLYHAAIFPKTMWQDRFTLILKLLHVNDNGDPLFDKDDDRDWIHKIHPIIGLLRDRCQKVYQPEKNLSIDESHVLFQGPLHFKQFIQTKRSRIAVKLYELTASDSMTLDFMIYCGKGMFKDDDPFSEMPNTECIPSILMECFF